MKRFLGIAFVLALAFGLFACSAPAAQPAPAQTQLPAVQSSAEPAVEAVAFGDPILEKMVRGAMGKPEGDIAVEEAQAVVSLNLGNKDFDDMNSKDGGIRDISALKYFTGLKELGISFNEISDLTPLSGLKNLETLDFSGTRVEDITPLKDLTSIKCLVFCWMRGDSGTPRGIESLDALANMQSLEMLDAKNAGIEDISGLADLPKLWEVQLNDNFITDISPLAKLKNLKTLLLDGNPVKDFSPLKDVFPTLEGKDFEVE